MNPRTSTLLACAALSPLLAPARAADVTTTVTPSFVSQYMFRGVRLGGPSFQPTVEVAIKDLTIGVWANTPLADKVPGQSDPEIDPYVGYTMSLNDSLSVTAGIWAYTYPRADTSTGWYKYSVEPDLGVNWTYRDVKLTPKLYYDAIVKGATYELSASWVTPLKDEGTEINWTVTLGTYKWTDITKDANPSVKNWGNYYQVGFTMPFEVTKTSKLVFGLAYTKGSGNYIKAGSDAKVRNAAAVGRGFVTLSYALSF
jgi:uncharacterized protein (TIGR02001 family)